MIKKYVRLFRIKHYIKNLLIFIPVFFNHTLFDEKHFVKTFMAFWSFSLMASIIYAVNDIYDAEADKNHATKRNRPIASGEISIPQAIKACIVLEILSLLIFFAGNPENKLESFIIYISYIILNVYYSVGRAKEIPILDIFILASGFVLRIMFGAAVSGVVISNWLYLVAMTGSLYFGLGKRRNEIVSAKSSRNVLKRYTYYFLDKYMYVCITAMFIFYSLWCNETITNKKGLLIWSVPLILAILMKYGIDIEKEGADGDPVETFFHDMTLFFLCAVYAVLVFISIYL